MRTNRGCFPALRPFQSPILLLPFLWFPSRRADQVHCGISKSRKPLNINMACWSFCFHLILFGLAKSCGETPVRPGKVAMNYWSLTASSKRRAVHFSVFLSIIIIFLNLLNFTESRQWRVGVVQTCFTNWDKYVDVREKKPWRPGANTLSPRAQTNGGVKVCVCVRLQISRELTPDFKKCMKNTGLFLSFSRHREKANGSQNARGEHSSNNARARGADQRESCLRFSGLQGNSSADSQVRELKENETWGTNLLSFVQ